MPSLLTRFFGELEYSDDAVIQIPSGLPPFVSATRFLLLADEHRKPLVFVQSIDTPELCFIALPAELASPGYTVDLTPEDLAGIGWTGTTQPQRTDVTCLAIVTVPEQGPVTANLMAPLVINARKNLGVQAIRTDGRYSHAEPLVPAVPAQEALC